MGRLGKVSRAGRNRQEAVFFPAGCSISEDNVNSSSTAKTILFWISIVFLGVMLWKLVSANGSQTREDTPTYSVWLAKVDAGEVKEVTMYLSPNSYDLQGEYYKPANMKFQVTIPKEEAPTVTKALRDKAVQLRVKEVRSGDWVLILLNAAPLILLVGFCLFLMRQMQSGGNKALSFGKSRARLLSAQQKKATFKDVAGTDEAKEELQEIIEFLKDPQQFQKLGGGNDEREQTLNALLVEMDGFETNEGVILIAATNRPDVLDPALLRPGRFDRRVVVARPDVKGREEILRVHTRKVPISDDVDLSIIARGTPGFSGADLANLVNEAALWAARQNRKFVMMVDFEMSKDKVMMGVERRSMILSDEEKKNTAYHEAGHALVAAMTPGADPVHKVTIIPRGMALGLTMQLPEADKHTYTCEYLEGMLAVLMGGRSAEEIFLGHITTGAGNDIERATDIARNMVCEWGMSELGPLAYGKKDEAIFLGREIAQHRDYSEDTAIQIDKEVKRIVNGGYENAKNLLAKNRDTLERIAQALLEREVIDANEVKLLMEGKPLPEKLRAPPAPPPQAAPSTDPKAVRPELRPAPGFTRGENPAKA